MRELKEKKFVKIKIIKKITFKEHFNLIFKRIEDH